MVTVGVLGLQGACREHLQAIEQAGATALLVKRVEQLEKVDGLVLPGGESTAMRRLMDQYGFINSIKEFSANGKPIFGTCAGLILLAKKIVGQSDAHLGLMNITVERNSFGRQKDSFEAEIAIAGIAEDKMDAVFIRAPHILEVGENVEVLSKYEGRIVAAREGQYLCCSFHPELTEDIRLTKYFIEMVQETRNKLTAV